MNYCKALLALAAVGVLGLAACESDNVAPAAATQTGIDNSGPTTSRGAPTPSQPGRDTTAPQTNGPRSDAPPPAP